VEGAGLGLAIVKRLVEAMDGAAGVESAVGRRAFLVELRVRARRWNLSGPCLAGARGQRRRRTSGHGALHRGQPAQPQAGGAGARFRPSITLVPAMQGTLGLDLARQHRPDLILLDLNLPDLQGDEVLARLQTDAATRGIPVVIISADATPGQIERLLAAGASDYLTKPLEVRRLLDLLDATLAREATRR
jgi:CheY-like chemotaxis protein